MRAWASIGALCLTIFCSAAGLAAERAIDVERSSVHIHVGKSGLFSAAGHEHWVTAPIERGNLDDGEPPHIAFTIAASKLTVEPDSSLGAAQQAEVQRTMQDKVLDSKNYPEISFRSSSVEASGNETWAVHGALTLHGQSHPVTTVVHREQGRFVGQCRIKQTDFGIQPVRIAAGTVKVKNELEINFSIVPAEEIRR